MSGKAKKTHGGARSKSGRQGAESKGNEPVLVRIWPSTKANLESRAKGRPIGALLNEKFGTAARPSRPEVAASVRRAP